MTVVEDVGDKTLLCLIDESMLQRELCALDQGHRHLEIHDVDHNKDNHNFTWYNYHNNSINTYMLFCNNSRPSRPSPSPKKFLVDNTIYSCYHGIFMTSTYGARGIVVSKDATNQLQEDT